jgi:hypothetical protein
MEKSGLSDLKSLEKIGLAVLLILTSSLLYLYGGGESGGEGLNWMPEDVRNTVLENRERADYPNEVVAIAYHRSNFTYRVITKEEVYQIQLYPPIGRPQNWAYNRVYDSVESDFRTEASWSSKPESEYNENELYLPEKDLVADLGLLRAGESGAKRQFEQKSLFVGIDALEEDPSNSELLDNVSDSKRSVGEYLKISKNNVSGPENTVYALVLEDPIMGGNIHTYKYRIYTLGGTNITYRHVTGGPGRKDTGYLMVEDAIQEGLFRSSHSYGNREIFTPEKAIRLDLEAAERYRTGSGLGEETIQPEEKLFFQERR